MNQSSSSTFFFNNLAVGQFANGICADGPGDVDYMPFRGPGHLQMQEALKRNEQVICSFKRNEVDFEMAIACCPGYGVLRISSIEPKINNDRTSGC